MTECTSDGSRASGGTVTIVGDYVIHTFISDGTFANADSTLTEIDVLVVGGGGGGSTAGGGGGGGGGGGPPGGGAILYSFTPGMDYLVDQYEIDEILVDVSFSLLFLALIGAGLKRRKK